MSYNFVEGGIRSLIRDIKRHKYMYPQDKDYIEKISEYENTLSEVLNEIENMEVHIKIALKDSDEMSIPIKGEIISNGIGAMIYYCYGVRGFVNTVVETLHMKEMKEFSGIMSAVNKARRKNQKKNQVNK